jgi:hypothetical protein
VTHPTPFVLRITRLPVGRRASGFVQVAKCLRIGPQPRHRIALLERWANKFEKLMHHMPKDLVCSREPCNSLLGANTILEIEVDCHPLSAQSGVWLATATGTAVVIGEGNKRRA